MVIVKDKIAWFRLLSLRQALKLEMVGMKRRGRSAYSIIKSEFGLKGSRQSVLEQFEKLLREISEEVSDG